VCRRLVADVIAGDVLGEFGESPESGATPVVRTAWS
jgi:hypothetical protein